MNKPISKEKKSIVDELYRRALKNFPRRKTIIKGLDDLWQADLAVMLNEKKYNRGYTNILLVIDCFSKFLWTLPLKTKNGLNSSYSFLKTATIPTKFSVGDIVRISKENFLFEKGYSPRWSAELFKVIKIKPGNPSVFYLEDMNGVKIQGAFYAQEIQKTSYPNTYLIERVLRRRGNNVLVKWLGFEKKDSTSWIRKEDML